MGYDRYAVPDTVAVKPTFVTFLQHSQTYIHGLSCYSFKFLGRTVNSKPPTIPYGIVHFFQQPFSKQLYINTWRACQTKVYHSQIFDWKQFLRHKFLCRNNQSTNKQVSLCEHGINGQLITSRVTDDYRNLQMFLYKVFFLKSCLNSEIKNDQKA